MIFLNLNLLNVNASDTNENNATEEILNDPTINLWDRLLSKSIENNIQTLEQYDSKTLPDWIDKFNSLVFWDTETKIYVVNLIKHTNKISLKNIKENKISDNQILDILNIKTDAVVSAEEGGEPKDVNLENFLFERGKKLLDEEKTKIEAEKQKIQEEKIQKEKEETAKKADIKKYILIGLLCLIAVFLVIRLAKKVM